LDYRERNQDFNKPKGLVEYWITASEIGILDPKGLKYYIIIKKYKYTENIINIYLNEFVNVIINLLVPLVKVKTFP